jgi:dipeptidyl aminopeptidase/acylaminoacyl peptidase
VYAIKALKRIIVTVTILNIMAWTGSAFAMPPVEVFGAMPDIQDISLSPDGKYVAYLMHRDGKDMMLVRELDNSKAKPVGLNVSKIKPRSVSWANNRYVLLHASKTVTTAVFAVNKIEFGAVFAYDITSGRVRQLLNRSKELGINSSLGSIARILPDEDIIMMPAYTGRLGDRRVYSLFRVNLGNGIGKVSSRGHGMDTDRFIVDKKGAVIARIDYSEKKDTFHIKVYKNRRWEIIYTQKSGQTPLSVKGFSADKKSLLITYYQGRDTIGLYAMSLKDGSISGPVQWREHADIISTLTRPDDGVVFAVGFADIAGTDYVFLDPEMKKTWAIIKQALGAATVQPVNWSKDNSKWLLFVENGNSAGAYMVYDARVGHIRRLATRRPAIKPADVGPVHSIEYKAADGTQISALLTTPPGYQKHPAPMVVLPHGGPASHESMTWDWMAQYLANQGYLVLQPNFRGSDGFGQRFENAGDGTWNSLVLGDVTAGVQGMIRAGYADPKRICIAGASFGGYLTLAGLVFTPDLYACAVAIAPLSDMKAFLAYKTKSQGKDSRTIAYWTMVMQGKKGKENLNAISPAKHANAAKAPLLLIHGLDDTVVPIAQSRIMKRALIRAKNPVQMVTLRGEDHWLSSAQTRTETLRAMGTFLRPYLANNELADNGANGQ